MFAAVLVRVEVSDDDEELAAIASQCGYDFIHPQVVDVDEPVVADYHGEACLLLRVTLADEFTANDVDALLSEAKLSVSHPSIAACNVLAIQLLLTL